MPASEQTTPNSTVIGLPEPQYDGEVSLEQSLLQRRSIRSYTGQPLTLQAISQLLWAAQGISDATGLRTAPSAGALYPMELYFATARGVFSYDPHEHSLQQSTDEDVRARLANAALGQQHVADATCVIVITGAQRRLSAKYGKNARKYMLLEAGHIAQNILLQAESLGLGAVPVGAFSDSRLAEVLALPPDHAPLYLIPVGAVDGK